ncbi:MAG: DUF2939 domain-containing protein [Thiohalocapsa sp.]
MKAPRALLLVGQIRRPPRSLRRGMQILTLGVGLLLIWPYVDLWRLNELVLHRPAPALARLVDIDSVRNQILRRLNKDAESSIGQVSDPFIEWIERSIRVPGNKDLEQSVTLEWLHALLAARGSGDRGFLPAVRYAFYSPPNGFLVRIGAADQEPIFLRMRLGLLGWRFTAAYH